MTIESDYHKRKPFPSFKQGIDETDEVSSYHKLKVAPSFINTVEAAAIGREGSEADELLPRYTSLKDVMANSPAHGGADIAIRNLLVKHAASAYVLSASVISPASRDQDSRIWERIKMCCIGFLSCRRIGISLLPLFTLISSLFSEK